MSSPLVAIVSGSKSDLPTMSAAEEILDQFEVPFETLVSSAHRNPNQTATWAAGLRERGVKVVIAAAGYAAHLAGAIAAQSTLPVIGVPIDSSPLNGLDSLLSTVMMPSGVPVATVTIGRSGAKNAAVLAVQILSLGDTRLADRLVDYKARLAGG